MRGLGTNHVISGQMRGIKKTDNANKQTYRQTSGHRDSMTESAQWGRLSENHPVSFVTTLVLLQFEFCLN